MEEFLTQLNLKPASPRVSVYNNSFLYYFNLVTTMLFIVIHVLLMLTVFNFWGQGQWLVIVYSALQLSLGLYSLGVTTGEIALQAFLMGGMQYAKMLLFILTSISIMTLSVATGLYFYDPTT